MRPDSPRRSTLAVVLLLALTLLAAGCTTASPSPSAYQERTKLAVTDAISHVATAQKVLEATRDGKVLDTYALATVRASDDTLNTAVGAYLELYPPDPADRLFTRASTLLGKATDLVTESRIALYRDDRADLPRLIEELKRLTDKLEQLEKDLA